MNQDRTQREVGEWCSLLTICSNVSMFDYMSRINKSNAAGVSRIFEFIVPDPDDSTPGRIYEPDATRLQQELEDNFGRIGEKYSLMLSQVDAMRETVSAFQKQITDAVGEEQNERFWVAITATILAGARTRTRLEQFSTSTRSVRFLLRLTRRCERELRRRSYRHEEAGRRGRAHGLPQGTQGEHTIRTHDVVRGRGSRNKRVRFIAGPRNSEAQINVQWVIDDRLLRISRPEFTDFMNRNHYSPSMVLAGLAKNFNVVSSRATLTAGTVYNAGGQEQILEIGVPPGSWMEEQMNAYDPSRQVQKASDHLEVIQSDQQS